MGLVRWSRGYSPDKNYDRQKLRKNITRKKFDKIWFLGEINFDKIARLPRKKKSQTSQIELNHFDHQAFFFLYSFQWMNMLFLGLFLNEVANSKGKYNSWTDEYITEVTDWTRHHKIKGSFDCHAKEGMRCTTFPWLKFPAG